LPTNLHELSNVLFSIKKIYEDAIREGRKLEEIRSQRIIKLLHEYVINELENNGIKREWIQRDAIIHGFPKTKQQDILIQPPHGVVVLKQNRKTRKIHVGPLMSVNIRSQLSSIDKNYDTLYERLFAEALNIHNQFPRMILGYVYLIPLVGYSESGTEILFTEEYDLEKYIISFSRINNRRTPSEEPWKYERICLLIVDFKKTPPTIIEDSESLVREGRISSDIARTYNLSSLGISTFFDDLLYLLKERYYEILKY